MGSCHRHHSSFDAWERVRVTAHQKCPEDDAGVSPAGDRADQVCRNHEASEADSQRDCGNGEAVKGQKDIPDSASGCVVGRHDDCKRVTTGEVKGNRVL